jgi:hypothetical protein
MYRSDGRKPVRAAYSNGAMIEINKATKYKLGIE